MPLDLESLADGFTPWETDGAALTFTSYAIFP